MVECPHRWVRSRAPRAQATESDRCGMSSICNSILRRVHKSPQRLISFDCASHTLCGTLTAPTSEAAKSPAKDVLPTDDRAPTAQWVRGRWQVRVPMVTNGLTKRSHRRTRRLYGAFHAVSCSARAWARCSPLVLTGTAQTSDRSRQLRRSSIAEGLTCKLPTASEDVFSSYAFDIELCEQEGAQSPTAASAAVGKTAQERMASERGAIFGIPTAPNARNRTADGVDEAVGIRGLKCYTPEEIAGMVLPGSGYRYVGLWPSPHSKLVDADLVSYTSDSISDVSCTGCFACSYRPFRRSVAEADEQQTKLQKLAARGVEEIEVRYQTSVVRCSAASYFVGHEKCVTL